MEHLQYYLKSNWFGVAKLTAACTLACLMYFFLKFVISHCLKKKNDSKRNSKNSTTVKKKIIATIIIFYLIPFGVFCDALLAYFRVNQDIDNGLKTKTVVGVFDIRARGPVIMSEDEWVQLSHDGGIYLLEGRKYEVEYFVHSKVICSAKRVYY